MQISLPSNLYGKVGVKYVYPGGDNPDTSTGPIATKIWLTLQDKDGAVHELYGEAHIKGTDKFDRRTGRKMALISLIKRQNHLGLLTRDDKECLFRELCPYYFSLNRKEEREMKRVEREQSYLLNEDGELNEDGDSSPPQFKGLAEPVLFVIAITALVLCALVLLMIFG